jgi:hypothetical protein
MIQGSGGPSEIPNQFYARPSTVGRDSLPEHSRNAVDGQKADVGTPKPHIVTWADIARKRTLMSKSLALRASTLKVRGKE